MWAQKMICCCAVRLQAVIHFVLSTVDKNLRYLDVDQAVFFDRNNSHDMYTIAGSFICIVLKALKL